MPHVLLLLLCFALSAVATAATSCATDPRSQSNCGHSGITQQLCLSLNCCWLASEQRCAHPTTASLPPLGSPPFNTSEMQLMRGYFKDNLNFENTGACLASPDNTSPSGYSYRYDWIRDSALSNNAWQLSSTSETEYDRMLQAYAYWVVLRQVQQDPFGIDPRIEPKFEVPSGDVYNGSWCRPQNDGPGLRAITLIQYALDFIPRGGMAYVKEILWTGNPSIYKGGAIKYHLDWITLGWQDITCDLWEEVQSTSFFWGLYTSRKALILGASFAAMMNDTESQQAYLKTLSALNSTLAFHIAAEGYVLESTNRPKDSAVICAFTHADMNDGVFKLTGKEVAATVSTLTVAFHQEYPINSQDDKTLNIPGILFGRYPGDVYGGGNPWILCSGCLADLLYRAGNKMIQEAEDGLDAEAEVHWRSALQTMNYNISGLSTGDAKSLGKALVTTADGVLLRVRSHVENDRFHLYEQIDRNNGTQTSVYDLTWSYGEVFNAMMHRPQL
jgi:glucoamylase